MTDTPAFSPEEIAEIVCAKLVSELENNRTPQAFFDAMAWPNHALEVAIASARGETLGLQCAADCTACCEKMPVITTPSFLVLAWIWFHGSGAASAGTMDASTDIGCAFSIGRRCTVYPFRPSVCRIFHSRDRADCDSGRFSPEAVTKIAPPLARGVLKGIQSAMDRLGIDNRLIILKPGIRVLAAGNGVVTRWLMGEPVFRAHAETMNDQAPGVIDSRGELGL